MNTPSVQVSHNNESLSFNVSPQKLGGFISGLLGQPQEIQRSFTGKIDINKSFFTNIIQILNHRITIQNEGELTFFRAKILFEDDFERTLDNVGSFATYLETRSSRSVAAKITLTYLVQFADKPNPEKQEISILVNEGISSEGIIDGHFLSNSTGNGLIFYKVSHTERSFGDDIASLLDRECEKAIEKPNFFLKNLSEISTYTAITTILVFLILPFWFESNLSEKIYLSASQVLEASRSINSGNIASLNVKIDALTNFFLELYSPRKYYKIIQTITFIIGIVMGFIFIKIGSFKPLSFVTFGEKSESYRDKKIKKGNFIYAKFFGTFALNIIAGLIGSYLYSLS